MCQNSNLHKTSPIGGAIVLSERNHLYFLLKGAKPFPRQKTICPRAHFTKFARFGRYCLDMGIIVQGSQTVCDVATMRQLYQDFETMEFNNGMTSILYKNGIVPIAPGVNALNCESGKKAQFDNWLDKARRWLQRATGAGFFNIKKARRYHTASQDK